MSSVFQENLILFKLDTINWINVRNILKKTNLLRKFSDDFLVSFLELHLSVLRLRLEMFVDVFARIRGVVVQTIDLEIALFFFFLK